MGLLGFAVLLIVALLGLLGVLLRRNGKRPVSGGSNSTAHLATIEALSRQTVHALEGLRSDVASSQDGVRSDLTDVKVVLGEMKAVIGGCSVAQQFRGKGGAE